LALKYKLRTAVTDGDDVVFYGENGKINATERYNEMNNYYEIMSEDAGMSINIMSPFCLLRLIMHYLF
jgi:hypothetical protein